MPSSYLTQRKFSGSRHRKQKPKKPIWFHCLHNLRDICCPNFEHLRKNNVPFSIFIGHEKLELIVIIKKTQYIKKKKHDRKVRLTLTCDIDPNYKITAIYYRGNETMEIGPIPQNIRWKVKKYQ